jgi:outer membrane protein TolC
VRRWARLFAVAAATAALPVTVAAQSRAAAPVALTLDEALRRAGATSEQVGTARAGADRARGLQAQARSALLPQVGTTLSWQKQLENQFAAITRRAGSGDGGNGGGADSALTNNPISVIFASPYTMVFGLTAQQALFTGGRTRALIRASGLGRESAEIGIGSASAQVQLDVTQAYYDAVLADRLLQIAESSLVQTERTLRQVQLSRDVGAAAEFDLIRARVTRDNQRPVYLQSRTQRDLAHLRLRQLIDAPADQPLVLVDGIQEQALDVTPLPPEPTPTTVTVSVADVLAIDPRVRERVARTLAGADTATTARAPVRQAEKGLEVARQQLRASRAQRYPSLGLSTNYQRFAYPANGFANSLTDFFPNWTVGLQVSWPFFSGGRVRGEIMAAEAGVVEAEQRLKQVREGAELETRQAIAQLEEAEATWIASIGTADQAARAYEIAEVRFREGISTQLELSESRVQLQQALANRARAARDVQVARVRLALLHHLPLAGMAGPVAPGAGATPQGTTTGGAQGTAPRAAGSFTPPGTTP